MCKLIKERHQHSLLWWLIIGVSLAFGGLLILVSMGWLPVFDEAFKHFSPLFFLVTLAMTIYMSYKRAQRLRGHHYVGPFLCSVLFAILTQFILFLLSPLLVIEGSLSQLDILSLAFAYIFPSWLAFVLIKYLVDHKEFQENNQWFDWHFYVNWVELMSNAMTLVIFLELVIQTPPDASFLGIRGTIWAFYAVMAGFLSESLTQRGARMR